MKATIRIPTEPYAYIEVEIDADPATIVQTHDEIMELYKKEHPPLKDNNNDW